MRPASAVPVYCDLQSLAALCERLDEPPATRFRPWAGWPSFCRWAVEQPDARSWRMALASFARWQGCRDDTLIQDLSVLGGVNNLRRAWLLALSRPEGALFAGWTNLRACSSPTASFVNGHACALPYVALQVADRDYTAVLSGPGLLDDVDASCRHLARLYAGALTPVLLVARMDRSRVLTPVFAAVGAA